jgi:hypothetical protein
MSDFNFNNIDDIISNGLAPLNEELETITSRVDKLSGDIAKEVEASAEQLRAEIIELTDMAILHSIQPQINTYGRYLDSVQKNKIMKANKFITEEEYGENVTLLDDSKNIIEKNIPKIGDYSQETMTSVTERMNIIQRGTTNVPIPGSEKDARDLAFGDQELFEMEAKLDKQYQEMARHQEVVAAAEKIMNDAEEALEVARINNLPMNKLRKQFERSKGLFERENETQEAMRTLWNGLKTDLDKGSAEYTKMINAIKEYQGLGKYDPSAIAFRKSVEIADDLIEPLKIIGPKLGRVGDILFDGYQKYIRDFMKTGDAELYYERVVGKVGELAKPQIARMESEIKAYENLVRTGEPAEALYALTAGFMSPSWRLFASTMDEFQLLRELSSFKFEIEFLFNGVRWILFALKSVVRVSGSIGLGILEGLGSLTGKLGSRVALAVSEASLAWFEFMGNMALKLLAPEIQAFLIGAALIRDAFTARNVYQFLDDAIQMIPGGSLINIDALKIHEYPEFSQQAKHVNGDETIPPDDPMNASNLSLLDTLEIHGTLNFWGAQYIKIMQKKGHKYPDYKFWTPPKILMRVPGKYIRKGGGKFDTAQQYEDCERLESELEYGELVDETGRLSPKDNGNHLVSGSFPKSKKKDIVRNLVDFPLYSNTAYWPPIGGSPYQIKGMFVKDEIDPTIAGTFEKWVTDGTWGPTYNTSKVLETRRKAAETNKADYEAFLNPKPNDPNVWIDIKLWVQNNRGTRAVFAKSMYSMRLDQLDAEMARYDDVNDSTSFWNIVSMDTRAGANTLNFIESVFHNTGRYPATKNAFEFYNRVIDDNQVLVFEMKTNPGGFPPQIPFTYTRDPQSGEVAKYKRIKNMIIKYRQALVDYKDDIDKVWTHLIESVIYPEYILDTKRDRTPWGYINKYKMLLFNELQGVTQVYLLDQRTKVWKAWLKYMAKVHIPLNINSYQRAKFMGVLNQLVYATNEGKINEIETAIRKQVGDFESHLVTTGLTSEDKKTWAAHLAQTADIIKGKADLSVLFGNIHCQVITIQKPKPTVFVIFRGTTNAFETLVDLDFSGADFAKLVPDGHGGFEAHVFQERDSTIGSVKKLIWGEGDNFSVHRGFLRAWLALKPKVLHYVTESYRKYNIQDVMISGHSLGAAIAQVCCLEFPGFARIDPVMQFGAQGSTVYQRPHAYLFSSPNVGDARFSSKFQEQVSESIHLWNDGDVITMIPPFLIPNETNWAQESSNTKTELEALFRSDGNAWANSIAVINYLLGASNVPPIIRPFAWFKSDGSFDIEKIYANIGIIYQAWNQHRAIRGGGLFIRLDQIGNGKNNIEQPYDMGNSIDTLKTLLNNVTSKKKNIATLHSLDNVLKNLDGMVAKHPDAFSEIDGKMPSWADVNPVVPGKLSPVPQNIEDLLNEAVVIGFAHTKRKYEPFQIVDKNDVDQSRAVAIPFSFKDAAIEYEADKRRKMIRRKTEGNYHGY